MQVKMTSLEQVNGQDNIQIAALKEVRTAERERISELHKLAWLHYCKHKQFYRPKFKSSISLKIFRKEKIGGDRTLGIWQDALKFLGF